MKRICISILFVCATIEYVQAQNVGIGNTNPAYTLDLSGRLRIRGGIDNDNAAGIWLNGSGAESMNLKTFIGHRNDTSIGFYGIGYDWMFNVDPRNGHLGMGGMRAQANVELALSNEPGNKISLYQTDDNKFYGFGLAAAGALQVITPYSTNDVVFGTGRSSNFTENMRLTGSGNLVIGATAANQSGLTVNKRVGGTNALFGSNTTGVAIESSFPGIGFNSYASGSRKTLATGYSGYVGVNPIIGGMQFMVSTQSNNTDVTGNYKTAIDIKPDGKVGVGVSDPGFVLDVAERMRIRSIPGYTAGLWFNNDANTAAPAFVGMYADNQVGFYGTGTAWGFLMNTQTGAISLNGNAGQQGQVLTSNGTGGPPTWQGGGSNNVFVAKQPNTLILSNGTVDVPGLVANFTLNAPSRVLFHFGGSLFSGQCLACADKRVFLFLMQNVVGGTTEIARAIEHVPVQLEITVVSAPAVLDLPAGTYSFKVEMMTSGANSCSLSGAQLTWQIFSQ
jgi:hypothetical protein